MAKERDDSKNQLPDAGVACWEALAGRRRFQGERLPLALPRNCPETNGETEGHTMKLTRAYAGFSDK